MENYKSISIIERELGFIQGVSWGVSGDAGELISDSVDLISDELRKMGVLFGGKDGDE